ncbi:hypothetical protein ACLOJK_032680 [Asimina triloba]
MATSFPALPSSCMKPLRKSFVSLNREITTTGVQITEGEGKLPKLVLTSVHGSEAEIYLFGGCVTSWKVANNKDLLFVRPDAVFNGQKPISCGIIHGFARNMNWSVADTENLEGNPVVTLELTDSPYSRSMWDFTFQALYKASVTGASVNGLKGCKTLNKDPDPSNPIEGKEERDVVTYPGFVDCIYVDAPNELVLDNGLDDKISIRNTNWSDAVLWNPHLQMEAFYRDFVCVENAKIGKVELEPEQTWVAEQQMSLS